MPKDKNRQKINQHRHYVENKQVYRKRFKQRRIDASNYVQSVKNSGKCSKCGKIYSKCLDFHHIDPNSKVRSIADMVRRGASITSLQTEMQKCVLLCNNCHKKEHSVDLCTGNTWVNFNKARIKKRQWYIDYIKTQKCSICNEDDVRCLDHHHIHHKRFSIAYLLTSGHSLSFLQEEISRCIVVCGNCHREIHWRCK